MKVTPDNPETTIKTKQTVRAKVDPRRRDWWNANSKKDLMEQILSNTAYLKQNQQYRLNQAGTYSRLYGNMPMYNVLGSSISKVSTGSQLPLDRPTMNVVQSCVDTLVSRVTQQKPRPIFLTDNGDTKMRSLAKQLNQFILGEFYQTKAYRLTPMAFTEACVLGTGCMQVYENPTTKRVAVDRVLQTELYVDPNDSMYGFPTQLYRMKLVERGVLEANFPDGGSVVDRAEQAYPNAASGSDQTIADQVMVDEAWHLPSGANSSDGLHVIVCSSGILIEEDFKKPRFPFAFLQYNPRLMGFWGQPMTEQLFGTQMEINKLLMTTSKALNLMGVPSIWIEDGSKVVKSHFNNEIGRIQTYRGQPPIFMTPPSNHPELYERIQTLIQYAYQQVGISEMMSQGRIPMGLQSGEAVREVDNQQSDRLTSVIRRWDDFHVDLAYLMIDQAKDICERDGSYQTIYPDKDGTREIDLPAAKLLDDPFVIQCYDTSSLPKDPAGRKEYVVEMMQAGIYSPDEGRRLLGFSDTEQEDKLATAAEERVLKYLDDIVEHGTYTPPDPFMDLALAEKLVVQYYNLHVPAKLTESRAQQLRDFKTQIDTLMQAAQPPAPPPMAPGMAAGPGGAPMGVPNPQPQNDLLPIS